MTTKPRTVSSMETQLPVLSSRMDFTTMHSTPKLFSSMRIMEMTAMAKFSHKTNSGIKYVKEIIAEVSCCIQLTFSQ